MKNVSILLATIGAAVAASACCILPLVLGVAGAGSLGFGTLLTPYRPYLFALTLLMLGRAFFFAYRPAKGSCASDSSCSTSKLSGANRASKIILWTVAFLTAGVLAYPNIADLHARAVMAARPQAVVSSRGKTAVFALRNLTCLDCTLQIVDALKKTPGVTDATVDFRARRATVQYNPSRVTVPALRGAITRLGFPATDVQK